MFEFERLRRDHFELLSRWLAEPDRLPATETDVVDSRPAGTVGGP